MASVPESVFTTSSNRCRRGDVEDQSYRASMKVTAHVWGDVSLIAMYSIERLITYYIVAEAP
jgi:hypothetical protein